MADPQIPIRTAFDGLIQPMGAEPAGLLVAERSPALALVTARNGQAQVLAARLRGEFGLDLPPARRRVASGEVAFVWEGPGRWLAACEGVAGHVWEARLRAAAAGAAAVVDQSDGRAILRLSGPRLREVLAKGIGIDLHPRAFGPGSAASTALAHLGVQLWQIDDVPTFELAVPRSYAGSIWGWLAAAGAAEGIGPA